MEVYAIGDLHLSLNSDKPMDVFGVNWSGHFEKIYSDWEKTVKPTDVVLIPGDISWAMHLDDAVEDLRALAPLPGKKVFIRGNHDYWWNGITKLRNKAPDENFYFLQTDAVKIGKYVFVGSRGWTVPGSTDYTPQDEKLYLRETERFRLALEDAKKLEEDGDELIALIHYPPFSLKNKETAFTELFEAYGVKKVVFGHLHGAGYFPFKTVKNGITYFLTSSDKLSFKLEKICGEESV